MFILTTKELLDWQENNPVKDEKNSDDYILYRGFYFSQTGCFAPHNLEEAVKKCRIFLEREVPITSLILQEEDKITLWSEKKQLNKTENRADEHLIAPDNSINTSSISKNTKSVDKREKRFLKPLEESPIIKMVGLGTKYLKNNNKKC